MSDSGFSSDDGYDFSLRSLTMQQFFDRLQTGGRQVVLLEVAMRRGTTHIWEQGQEFDGNQPVEVFVNNAILAYNAARRANHRRSQSPNLDGRAAIITAKLTGPDGDEFALIKYLPPADYTIRRI